MLSRSMINRVVDVTSMEPQTAADNEAISYNSNKAYLSILFFNILTSFYTLMGK